MHGVEDLLRGLHVERDRLAVMQLAAARIGVEDVLGVEQIAAMLEQPLDPVVSGSATFFSRSQRENVVAFRNDTFIRRSAATHAASPFFMSSVPRP